MLSGIGSYAVLKVGIIKYHYISPFQHIWGGVGGEGLGWVVGQQRPPLSLAIWSRVIRMPAAFYRSCLTNTGYSRLQKCRHFSCPSVIRISFYHHQIRTFTDNLTKKSNLTVSFDIITLINAFKLRMQSYSIFVRLLITHLLYT